MENTSLAARPRLNLTIDPSLASAVTELVSAFAAAGGRALIIGGAVRDALAFEVGIVDAAPAAKDVDIEVSGLEPHVVRDIVARRFPDVYEKGVGFGVLAIPGVDIEIALPRRERKTGAGHNAFDVNCDPHMSFAEASSRRDFTINAIGYDLLTGEILDAHGGVDDLAARRLAHIGPAFAEDPARVLRAAQFAARFDLEVAPATIELCRSLLVEATTLSAHAVREETRKLVLKGLTPSRGLHFLDACGWLEVIHPEIAALRGVEQNPRWHPEGDVFVHTGHVVDFWSRHLRTGVEDDDLVVGLACLAHDFGKPATTVFSDGAWRAHGHEAAGVEPTRTWMARFGDVHLAERVVPLVAEHLAPAQLFAAGASDRSVRRLSTRCDRLDLLTLVAHADQAGRPPLVVDRFDAGEWLLAAAGRLGVTHGAPASLVSGRDLIALGAKPGPAFKSVLGVVFDAQLDGVVADRDAAHALLVATATDAGLLP